MGLTLVERSGEWQEKIVMRIENFQQFLWMSNEELELEGNGIIIEAGHCTLKDGTQIPAIWKYSFQCFDDMPGSNWKWFGGFLALHTPTDKSDVKSAKASYSLSFSSGGNEITSFVGVLQEFAGTSGQEKGRDKIINYYNLLMMVQPMNTLEVTLVVKVFPIPKYDPALKIPPPISAVQLKVQTTSDFVKMLESGDGADVEIKVPSEVGGEVDESSYTKKAHKGILMSRSSVFAKMFAKDSTMTEARTGVVVIKDLSPKGLNIFLRFLYTGEILQDWVHVGSELLNAAEKYDCSQLKEYCGYNILDAVSTSNALELYKSAKLHGLLDAAKRVVDFISKNTEAVIDEVVDESK